MMGVIGLGLAGQGPWLATLVLAQPAVHAFWYVRPSVPHTSEPVVGQVQSLGPVRMQHMWVTGRGLHAYASTPAHQLASEAARAQGEAAALNPIEHADDIPSTRHTRVVCRSFFYHAAPFRQLSRRARSAQCGRGGGAPAAMLMTGAPVSEVCDGRNAPCGANDTTTRKLPGGRPATRGVNAAVARKGRPDCSMRRRAEPPCSGFPRVRPGRRGPPACSRRQRYQQLPCRFLWGLQLGCAPWAVCRDQWAKMTRLGEEGSYQETAPYRDRQSAA